MSALYCSEHRKRKHLNTGLKLVLQRQLSCTGCSDDASKKILEKTRDSPIPVSFHILKQLLSHALLSSDLGKLVEVVKACVSVCDFLKSTELQTSLTKLFPILEGSEDF
jgi:hypothetical protein